MPTGMKLTPDGGGTGRFGWPASTATVTGLAGDKMPAAWQAPMH